MEKQTRTSEFSQRRNDNLYLYTKGNQYSLDGENYIGEYHIDGITPRTGPVPSPNSIDLGRVYTNKDHYVYDKLFSFDVPINSTIQPKPYIYRPTEQAYANGNDLRYFVEKINDEKSYAIEINANQYGLIGKKDGIDGGLYLSATVKWKLTGNIDDISTSNQLELQQASFKIPTILYSIKNFTEFARITFV